MRCAGHHRLPPARRCIDQLLRGHGQGAIHRPTAGPRRTDEALSQFDGIHGAKMASEPVTAEKLDSAAHLNMIDRSGIGYDSIDVDAATARGIAVGNTPGVNHHAVA